MKYYIIARSQMQGHHWVDNKRCTDGHFNHLYANRNDIVVVTRPEHLRGHNVEHGILLEGWRNIPDIEEILFLAMIHSQGKILALKQAYESICPPSKQRPTPKLRGKSITSIIVDELEHNDIR